MDLNRDLFTWLWVFTFGFLQASAGTHSLQFLYTAVIKGINLPEFIAVGQVDGEQVMYYDSNNKKLIPKTEWIKKDDAEFHWNDQAGRMWRDEDDLKQRLKTAMEQFNHNTGNHTMQRMYGCELDDDGTIRGYEQYSYDGEDFISLDLKTLTWIAATDEALTTKQKFEKNGYTKGRKKYLEKECIDWLKKCVSYSRETLERKETHTLQYFYTGVTGINFPEFTTVCLVDGEQITYYDSNSRKDIPKTEWIKKITAEKSDYWEGNTQIYQGAQESYKVNVATLMQRFNQTKGVHVVQNMYGCELDDDGTTRGYYQDSYDGADYISLDLKTLTWTAANAKAVITKHKWEAAGDAYQWKGYLEKDCIDWLKKYVSYGRETLERKVPPEVLMFQKFSSSPEVVCHATGFFPSGVMMSWQKDGEDLIEDVELRETLPNQDGSFQKRSILKVSPEDLQKHEYTCVIKHSSLKEDLVLKVKQARTVPDGGSGGVPIGIIVGAVVGVLALVLIVAGILVWKKNKPASQEISHPSSGQTEMRLREKIEMKYCTEEEEDASEMKSSNSTDV